MQLAEELSVRLEYVKSQQQAESASLLSPPSSTAFMDVWGIATLVHICAPLCTAANHLHCLLTQARRTSRLRKSTSGILHFSTLKFKQLPKEETP